MAAAVPFSPLLLLLLLLPGLPSSAIAHIRSESDDRGSMSVLISEKGLDFAKDLLVERAVRTLTPLHLHDIKRSVRFPVVGGVLVLLSNITLSHINVSSSTIRLGESDFEIVASGATANLSMDWYYTYSTWLFPVEVSDSGTARIQVEDMEVGLTMNMENQEGILKLTVVKCGCYVKDVFITLEGGTSWFYQGLVIAFEDQIRSAVETAINKKMTKEILKLDSLLKNLPKKIRVDDVASLNVTFLDDPLLGNSSIEFDIDGLFIETNKVPFLNYLHKYSRPSDFCEGPFQMLGISLDEDVFNSASVIYFRAGLMHWTVNKIPDQSLLNTAAWRFIIPQLYWMYPNDDMMLNISLTSPPVIKISRQNIDVTIFSDMVIDVLNGNETVSVACISVVVTASGVPEMSGSNLTGQIGLEDFTLKLKWSKIGNFHMHLIQGAMKIFLNSVAVPYVNSLLRKGFPLPIIRGFSLQNANIRSCDSRIVVLTDLMFHNTTIL